MYLYGISYELVKKTPAGSSVAVVCGCCWGAGRLDGGNIEVIVPCVGIGTALGVGEESERLLC